MHGHAIYKHKADVRNTCRIDAMGNELPHTPGFSSFASVASDDDKMLAAVLMQAHCEKHGDTLLIEDRDIVGGFLRPSDWSRLFM